MAEWKSDGPPVNLGPAGFPGTVGRTVTDGETVRTEVWSFARKQWIPHGCTIKDIDFSPRAKPELLIEVGIPPEDWT